jgi:hypothetical protein
VVSEGCPADERECADNDGDRTSDSAAARPTPATSAGGIEEGFRRCTHREQHSDRLSARKVF